MVFLETSLFTRQITETLEDENYAAMQRVLVERPDAGVLMRGGGGLRKMRWALPGRGKSGGMRVIYYWAAARDQILMLALYAKSAQANLSAEQLKVLRGIIEEQYP